MNVTIDAEQRAALWEDVTQDLTGIDAVYLAIQDRRWATARALRCQRLHDNASRHAHELLGGTQAALRGVEIYGDLLERLGDEPQRDPEAASA